MATTTLSVDQITQGFSPIALTVNNVECMLVERKAYEEMARAKRNAEYLAKLDKADEQIRNGQVVLKTMEELEAMAAE